MLCFEVLINGVVVSTAGVDSDGVMSAIVNWVTPNPRMQRSQELIVNLGGISGGNYTTWLNRDLRVGDEVTVRIVERETADEPTTVVRDSEARIREDKRRYFEEMKKEFGESGDA